MAFLTTARRVTAAMALVTTVMVCAAAAHLRQGSGAQAQVPSGGPGEDDVKAAYVYNFTKFVEWPASAFSGPADPLNVCVVGDAAVQSAVERILAGEQVEGRALKLVAPPPEGAAGCHVLFVGRGGSERGVRLLTSAGTAPMLTVGDSPRFLQQGGMIAFVVEERRVRFDISLTAAERVGLKLSSKLLRVARHVRRSRDSQ